MFYIMLNNNYNTIITNQSPSEIDIQIIFKIVKF